MAKLGELFVEITANNDKYNKAIDQTEKKTKASSKKIDRALGNLKSGSKKAAKAVAASLVAMTVASTKFASDLGESVNAVNVVFGESSDIIADWGDSASEQAGLSKRAFNESSAVIGTLLKKTGEDLDSVANSTINITKRSADLASVFNKDLSVATTAVGAALRGETEPIRQFGIDVSAAAVETEALSSGLVKTKGEITESVKVQARYNLIMKQSASLAGDFEKTNEDLANSSRVLKANIENAGAEMGTVFLPVATKIVTKLRDLTLSIKDQAPEIKDNLSKTWVNFGANTSKVLVTLTGGFKTFGAKIKTVWIEAVLTLQTAFTSLGSVIIDNVLGAVEKLLGVASKIPVVGKKFQEASNSVKGFKDALKEGSEEAIRINKNTIDLANKELEAVKASTEEKINQINIERDAKLSAIDEEREALDTETNNKRNDSKTELEIKADEFAEKDKINEEYAQKLRELSATNIELLQLEKDEAIRIAEERGLTTSEIELYYANLVAEEKNRLAEEEKQIRDEQNAAIIDGITNFASTAASIFGTLTDTRLNNAESEYQGKIESLDKELLGEEEYEKQVEALKQEQANKEYNIKKAAFETQKQLDTADTIISGAVAAQRAYASLAGIPVVGPALGLAAAVASAGFTIAQVGLINSQPAPAKPAFAEGGVVVGATQAIVGEDRGEVMLGMGAAGAPLIDELATRIASKTGGGKTVININSLYPPRQQDLDRLAEDLFSSNVKVKQRRGIQ